MFFRRRGSHGAVWCSGLSIARASLGSKNVVEECFGISEILAQHLAAQSTIHLPRLSTVNVGHPCLNFSFWHKLRIFAVCVILLATGQALEKLELCRGLQDLQGNHVAFGSWHPGPQILVYKWTFQVVALLCMFGGQRGSPG